MVKTVSRHRSSLSQLLDGSLSEILAGYRRALLEVLPQLPENRSGVVKALSKENEELLKRLRERFDTV